ncbi:Nuf2 family-domain-containing protein [Sporodiniella umbellata]|nr:Nuf2 family-domain-containing protein [Sporodiniella umbellata]
MNPTIRRSVLQDEHRISSHQFSTQSKEPPTFSVEEIVENLQHYGFQVTDKDILRPQAYRIQLLFKGIIGLISPWRADFMEKRRRKLLTRVSPDNPTDRLDLNENQITNLVLYAEFKSLLQRLGYTKLALTDLYNIQKPKLVRILSIVIHYRQFSEKLWETARHRFEPHVTQCLFIEYQRDIVGRAVHMTQACYSEREKLEQAKDVYEQNKTQIKELQAHMEQYADDLSQLEQRGKELTVEHRELKTAQKGILTSLHAHQETISLAKEKLAEHKARAAYDPDRIKEAIRSYKQIIHSANQSIHEMEESTQKWGTTYPHIKDISLKLETSSRILTRIQSEKAELHKAKTVNGALVEECDNKRQSLNLAMNTLQNNKNQLAKYEKQFESIKRKEQSSRKRDSAHREELDRKQNELKEKLQSIKNEERRLIEESRRLELETSELFYEEQKEQKKLDKEFQGVFSQLDMILEKLRYV